jgi:crossover junction endodeoxyribonuclease RuvC
MSIVLGIDPGYDRVGWAVGFLHQKDCMIMSSDCIQTDASDTLYTRYEQIFTELSKVIKKYEPDCCAIESLFFSTNAKTAMAVGEARGVIITAMIQHSLPVYNYTPLQIKMTLTGNGKATKKELQYMVHLLTKYEKEPKLDDEFDAMAVCYTHLHTRKTVKNDRISARKISK